MILRMLNPLTEREGGRERELSRIRFGKTRLLKGNVEFDHFKGLVRRSWAPLKKVEEEEKDCEKLCMDVVLAQWELK